MTEPANDRKIASTKDPFPGLDENERAKAVELIQRTYRGHRARRQLNGFGLDASTRWYEAVQDAQYRHITTPAPPRAQTEPGVVSPPSTTATSTPARRNWNRLTKIAQHAGKDDNSPSLSEISELTSESEGAVSRRTPKERDERDKKRKEATARRKRQAKMMDLQYFLEMVDHKHRYGSNLRKYHAQWKTQDTPQTFFYWLDQGEGRDLSLPECSRARLDKEQVRYLSREERLNYMVRVDEKGLLRWAKNGELVWTKDELYRDSMKGIVPTNDPTPKFKYNVAPETSSTEESEGEGEDELENDVGDEGERYVNEEFHRARGPAKIKYVSAGVLFNHMIRTSLKKGHKWIFVADTSFRMYIGYKQSGAFQHSSFLNGSRITAAGLIKVKHGQLRSLAPLSGHYRPPTANFRLFVQSLKEEGVDMSRVSISKSYTILVGMESYTRTKNKIKSAEESIVHESDKLFRPEKVRQEEEEKRDKSQSAEKERLYLEQQRLKQEQDSGKAKSTNKLSRTFSRALGRLDNNDSRGNAPKVDEGRGLPGTGPEDGVPPPEGDLLRR